MGLTSLVSHVATYFQDHEVPATAVYGDRARPAQGNGKAGVRGGRVSFLWTGKGKYSGPGWLGPRAADNTISRSGLIALVNDVRASRLLHWSTEGDVHLAAFVPAVAVPAAAENLVEAIDVGNVLRLAEMEHHGSLVAHGAADTANVITAPAASSAATLRTLALQLQLKGNLHARSLVGHVEADEEHDSLVVDPLATDAKTASFAQLVAEISVEVWAWDDSASTNDAAQWEAWLSLHEWTCNAIRSYARGVHKLERVEPATGVVHVTRGKAALVFVSLPIPIHELPARTPLEVEPEVAASVEFQKGAESDGTPIPPVASPVVEP